MGYLLSEHQFLCWGVIVLNVKRSYSLVLPWYLVECLCKGTTEMFNRMLKRDFSFQLLISLLFLSGISSSPIPKFCMYFFYIPFSNKI